MVTRIGLGMACGRKRPAIDACEAGCLKFNWKMNRASSVFGRVTAAGREAQLAGAQKNPLERIHAVLDALEAAVDARLDRDAEHAEAEAEVQRMNVDRARLAQELDTAEARAERLAEVNREVSRRLVSAMETIRAVIDR